MSSQPKRRPPERSARFRKIVQHRVDLQRLRNRLGTVLADAVATQPQDGQDPIENA